MLVHACFWRRQLRWSPAAWQRKFSAMQVHKYSEVLSSYLMQTANDSKFSCGFSNITQTFTIPEDTCA